MADQPLGAEEVRRALAEDRADDDRTTRLLGETIRQPARGCFIAEERCVVAGLAIAERVFRELAPEARLVVHVPEGAWAEPGAVLGEVTATAGALLAGERVALNFLQHLSGIATSTRRAVEAVAGTGAQITHTRKTLPGLRALQRYAVLVGGGVGNRGSLADTVYWKDNHWALLDRSGRTLAEVLAEADRSEVWVEVETDAQVREALDAGATQLLVDNQPPERVAEWARRAGPAVRVQASGGITADTAAAYARAGADLISMGALTHSVRGAAVRFDVLTSS